MWAMFFSLNAESWIIEWPIKFTFVLIITFFFIRFYFAFVNVLFLCLLIQTWLFVQKEKKES
jgi:hypothetical protein